MRLQSTTYDINLSCAFDGINGKFIEIFLFCLSLLNCCFSWVFEFWIFLSVKIGKRRERSSDWIVILKTICLFYCWEFWLPVPKYPCSVIQPPIKMLRDFFFILTTELFLRGFWDRPNVKANASKFVPTLKNCPANPSKFRANTKEIMSE